MYVQLFLAIICCAVLWTGCSMPEGEAALVRSAAALDEAVVIDGPHPLNETGMGIIRIESRLPDSDGKKIQGGALIALNLNVQKGDHVLTKVYSVLNYDRGWSSAYTQTPRIATPDPRRSPIRFKERIIEHDLYDDLPAR